MCRSPSLSPQHSALSPRVSVCWRFSRRCFARALGDRVAIGAAECDFLPAADRDSRRAEAADTLRRIAARCAGDDTARRGWLRARLLPRRCSWPPDGAFRDAARRAAADHLADLRDPEDRHPAALPRHLRVGGAEQSGDDCREQFLLRPTQCDGGRLAIDRLHLDVAQPSGRAAGR